MHVLQVAEILGVSSEQGSVSFLTFVSKNSPLWLKKGPFWGEREVGCYFIKYIQPQGVYPAYLSHTQLTLKKFPSCLEHYFISEGLSESFLSMS